MNKHTGRAIVVTTLAAITAPAQAQPYVASAATVAPVPTVVVSATEGAYDPPRDDTAAKIVVSSFDLARYGDASVTDALKRVPGITVISTGRGADIRMRGLGGGYTQILVNGERAPAGFSVDSLSPSQVERVEVIRSASAELPTESVAGTINIVLRKTVRKAQRQVQFGYGGNATERTPRMIWLLADHDGDFSYSVSANSRMTWFHRHRLIDDMETTPQGSPLMRSVSSSDEVGRLSDFNLLPRLNWTLAPGASVALESSLSFNRFHFSAARQSAATFGPAPAFSAFDWRITTRSVAVKSALIWSTRLTAQAKLDVKAGLQGSSGTNDSDRLMHGGAAPTPSATAVDTHEHGFTTSGKLAASLAETHQFTTGWEASRIRRSEINVESDPAVAGAIPVATLTSFTGTVLRTAAFVQDEWSVSPLWSVYLGARVERIGTSVAAARSWQTAATIWSPLAQALIKLPGRPDDQLRLALTRTFKAPELNSLMPRRRRADINLATNPDVDGNPLLRPEVARGVDLTYEHDFSKKALVSVGASLRHIDDYTLTQVTLDDDGRWVGRPVNAGQAQLRGLELETKFPLTLLHPRWPALALRASVSRNWSTVDQVPGPDNRVAQQVPPAGLRGRRSGAGRPDAGRQPGVSQGRVERGHRQPAHLLQQPARPGLLRAVEARRRATAAPDCGESAGTGRSVSQPVRRRFRQCNAHYPHARLCHAARAVRAQLLTCA